MKKALNILSRKVICVVNIFLKMSLLNEKKEVNMIKVKSLYELWYNIYFVLDIGSWIISRQKVHFSSPVSHTKNIVRYDTAQCSKMRKKFVKTTFWIFFPTERLQKRPWSDGKNFKNIDFSLFVLALKHTH